MSSPGPTAAALLTVARPLLDLGREVAEEKDLPTILQQALRAIGALVPVEDALLYLQSGGPSRTLSLRARLREGGEESEGLAAAQAALRVGLPEGESGGELSYVLSGGGRPLGVLIVRGRPDHPFDASERALLRAVADQVTIALQAAATVQRQQHRLRELSLLSEVANDCSMGIDHILPAVTQRVYRALELRLSLLMLLDHHHDELMWGYGFQNGSPISPTIRRFPVGDGFGARTLRTRQPSRGTPASIQDPRMRQLAEVAGIHHFGAVPLIVQDRPVGVFIVGRHDSIIEDDELRLLMAIGVQIAVAADNTRLLGETRQHAADLAAIQTVGAAMAHSLDPSAILREAVVRLNAAIACDGVRLYRREGTTFELVTREGVIPGAANVARGLPQDNDVIRRAFAAGRAIDVVVSGMAPPLREELEGIAVVRVAVVPLWITLEDRTESSPSGSFGLLAAVRRVNRPFSTSELAVLDAVGGQLAIAFRNAELHEETKRQAEERARLNVRLQESIMQLEQAQHQLVQRERLAALGSLAAQVAHEIRNPLGVITNSLGLLSKLTTLEGDGQRVYGILRDEVQRLDDIVGHMLDYTRPLRAHPTPVDVGAALRRALFSAQVAERSRGTPVDAVVVELAVAPDLPRVPLDEPLIHQALVNLIINAYQALGGEGTLRLGVALDSTGALVRVTIEDTGPGIPDELRERLFEPFQTTRAKGSGLGLAIVKRIVESHRGEISVDSGAGQGTRFTILLPLTPPAAGAG